MIDLLTNIKEQLFDAPSEVKEAFNQVVNYFSNFKNIREALESIKNVSNIEVLQSGKSYNFKYEGNDCTIWNGPDMYLVLVQKRDSDGGYSVDTKKNTILCNIKDLEKSLKSL